MSTFSDMCVDNSGRTNTRSAVLRLEFVNGKKPNDYAWYVARMIARGSTPDEVAADLRTLANLIEEGAVKYRKVGP